ncbi:transmembrane transport [Ascochyta rabiei]|uniref:Transmembrane transport n=1 Tax=Didymella rabiei TaxID=5454 RepID=A0A163KDE5_DIDRA|nr:transmembrane transport [Ascochyta rabiei]
MVAIDWENKIALLACLILAASTYGVTYIIALGWTTSTAAAYTKRLTRNAIFMLGYCVGNLVSPQIWVPSAGPRYYGAWISMIIVAWVGTPAILLTIRFILIRRNQQREKYLGDASSEQAEGGIVEELNAEGATVRVKVDLAILDLSDLQNKSFRYPI